MSFPIKVFFQICFILPLTNGFLFGNWFGGSSSLVTPSNSQDKQTPTVLMSVLHGEETPFFEQRPVSVNMDAEFPQFFSSEIDNSLMQNSMETTIESIWKEPNTMKFVSKVPETPLKLETDNTTNPAPQVSVVSKLDKTEEVKKKEVFNDKCYNKYPKAICENYRLYGHCEKSKSRLAYYCEQTCGFCTNECFNEEKTCTQTESNCQPKFMLIPLEKCKALCGLCDIKLSQEHKQALKAYKNVHNKDKSASGSWLFDGSNSEQDATLEK